MNNLVKCRPFHKRRLTYSQLFNRKAVWRATAWLCSGLQKKLYRSFKTAIKGKFRANPCSPNIKTNFPFLQLFRWVSYILPVTVLGPLTSGQPSFGGQSSGVRKIHLLCRKTRVGSPVGSRLFLMQLHHYEKSSHFMCTTSHPWTIYQIYKAYELCNVLIALNILSNQVSISDCLGSR